MKTTAERIWGKGEDGKPYVIGMTVAELRNELLPFNESDEICMSVSRKKGGGLLGKLKAVENGSTGQIWLKALVLDPSLE